MLKKINDLTLALVTSLLLVVPVAPNAVSALATSSAPSNPQATSYLPQAAGTTVFATAQSDIQCGINEAAGGDCSAGANNPSGDLSTTIKTILNILSAVAGVAAVIMLIVAGMRLVTSAGNEEGVKKAKGTIIYAVVGLVIVAVAQVIVHFVISTTVQ